MLRLELDSTEMGNSKSENDVASTQLNFNERLESSKYEKMLL